MVTELAMNWRRLANKWVRHRASQSDVAVKRIGPGQGVHKTAIKSGRPRLWRPVTVAEAWTCR
jgi:hypothetical protein